MAYQKGSATSYNDLLTQLGMWLTASCGWIQDTSAANGSGWRWHGHKNGYYVHLTTTPSGRPWSNGAWQALGYPSLWVYMSTAYAGAGQGWAASATGAPMNTPATWVQGVGCPLNNGTQTTYHFMHDGLDNYMIVVEITPGVFHHIGFGLSPIKRGGNWTGGAWFCGVNGPWWTVSNTANGLPPFHYQTSSGEVSCYIRCDVDTFMNKWIELWNGTNDSTGYTGRCGATSVIGGTNPPAQCVPSNARTINVLNSQATILPIHIYVTRDAGGFSLIATIPNIFVCAGAPGTYAPGSSYFIGADEYVLFPGFAVKKVA